MGVPLKFAHALRSIPGKLGWFALALAGLVAFAGIAGFALYLAYFGPSRLAADWRRLDAARALARGASAEAAFAAVYGDVIGPRPPPEEIRAWYGGQAGGGHRLVLDAAIAAYAERRFGQLDARTLPAGIYIAASPIGPDVHPLIELSHYALFTRHGYLLVVPPFREGAAPRPAIEVTASPASHFLDSDRAHGQMYAAMQGYSPGSPSFAKPGEPIHDLYRVSAETEEIERILANLKAAVARVRSASIPYRLLRRNSNSALACFLFASGLPQQRFEHLRWDPLFRLRLPAVAQPLWREPREGALPECMQRPARAMDKRRR